ncbi:MAG: hypothetical protein HRT72_06325 [Flavobacteriales bacterium]|nr:hypothetical protein [Flavobacteriales bacterium]
MVKKLLILGTVLYFSACTKEVIEVSESEPSNMCADTITVTFNNQVAEIMQRSCGKAGSAFSCHQVGSPLGDFNNYNVITVYVEDTSVFGFEGHIFTLQDMPPSYSDPSQILSDCDLQVLKTWLDNGAVKN